MTSNNDLILILGGVILVGIILFVYRKMNKEDWTIAVQFWATHISQKNGCGAAITQKSLFKKVTFSYT